MVERLEAAGLPARAEARRGLDHGVWVPLRLAFPEPRLPLVQVALPAAAGAAGVWRLGEVLAPLRRQGVMLVGSGSLTHNLGQVDFARQDAPAAPWAREFDAWVAARLSTPEGRRSLLAWQDAPHARRAHPSLEHLLPLHFVLGAALPGDDVAPVFEGFHHASLSMRSFALRAGQSPQNPQ